MMIDWGEDDSPPKLERWLLRRVFGYFRTCWRRGALALGWILGQSVRGLAPAVPGAYDTVVAEHGHGLNGGEKLRVAIARVILKDRRLLILDEATSHRGTRSEQPIQAAFDELFKKATAFVIAHRVSTVLAADQIRVMNYGRIVERGTHRGLVEQEVLYATLYERHFRAAADPDELIAIGG
jgi:ABC-type transport system involved in cytochrome bd biosynthesis fused ATPase/permease subunit